MSTTEIISNGSKWYGQAPDSIETLLGVMERNTISRWTGNPVNKFAPGHVQFFGNFDEVSHVFNIHTNDPELISTLVRAIRANRARRFAASR